MKRIRSESIALERLQPWDIAETLLPEYTEQQYQDLEEFLANGGQLAPVVIAEDCRIIDGYNRWRTAKRLEIDRIECDVYSYENLSEMEMHAIVLNSKRRHLNKLQVARAAVRLVNLLSESEPETEVSESDIPETPEQTTPEVVPAVETEQLDEPTDPAEITETTAPAIEPPPFHPDQTVREVSQKLGVPHSTVKQVSKVDKSGDELLISAMEDKVITIKQAAEIAELEAEQRRQAIEALDEEKKKKNNFAGVFSKTCSDCLKKLQRSRKKFKDAEFSETECQEMKSSIVQVIGEAKSLMQMLSDEMTEQPQQSETTVEPDEDEADGEAVA